MSYNTYVSAPQCKGMMKHLCFFYFGASAISLILSLMCCNLSNLFRTSSFFIIFFDRSECMIFDNNRPSLHVPRTLFSLLCVGALRLLLSFLVEWISSDNNSADLSRFLSAHRNHSLPAGSSSKWRRASTRDCATWIKTGSECRGSTTPGKTVTMRTAKYSGYAFRSSLTKAVPLQLCDWGCWNQDLFDIHVCKYCSDREGSL